MSKFIYVWFAFKTMFCTCQPDHKAYGFRKMRSHYKINKIGKLPIVASESSGLAKAGGNNTFWTHNDSGGTAELYKIDLQGKLVATETVPNAKNIDWEDLAQDNDGNLYIGDIGNNTVPRKSFDIYKFNVEDQHTEKITFHYAGQENSHSSPEKPILDSESFFYHDKKLWLFSKNWEKNKFVKLYSVPAEKGDYELAALDSIKINTQVTSADISPDGKTFALLTYGKILTFQISENGIDFKKPLACFRLVKKQNEALLFLNNTDMLVTNEQRNIYRIIYR
ncbi:esterase-like activity of phytase family protein [Dyadobacter arcticus]|uniref:Esterase-like activity of phytase family protein n=1 Tax=Dyadobacter arcticus TaxID=1078754 RepID=A0ABX0UVT9_9BACT|nr:esterase-like activity of phytase family protein [Dyadobacter arcticus]NIJ55910.1 hypothetical protein [Dyadobacter arcticus]